MKEVKIVSNTSEKDSTHSVASGGKVEQVKKSERHEEKAHSAKIRKNPSAIYNPHNDLWRHAPQKKEDTLEDICERSPVPSQSQKEIADPNSGEVSEWSSVVRAEQNTKSFIVASKNKSGRKLSSKSVRLKPRASADSIPTGDHSMPSASFKKQSPPKARDSLYIRQPAMPRFQRPGESTVKFTPKVYFKPQEESAPKRDELPVKEVPPSSRMNHSEVSDKLVANLTSAWYWSGYYAGYNARQTEE